MDQRRSGSNTSQRTTNVLGSTQSRITRNPFLNYLRDFRKSNNQKLNMTELAKRAATRWRSMTQNEKSPYVQLSNQVPKTNYVTAKSKKIVMCETCKRKREKIKNRQYDKYFSTDSEEEEHLKQKICHKSRYDTTRRQREHETENGRTDHDKRRKTANSRNDDDH